jgi:undecaprenyl-diphosphatase
MPLFHLILVAVIQGLTEFLPVSSSGHLILLPNLTGLEDQGQVIDVAVHVGTLGAVILYFWRDVRARAGGVPGGCCAGRSTRRAPGWRSA